MLIPLYLSSTTICIHKPICAVRVRARSSRLPSSSPVLPSDLRAPLLSLRETFSVLMAIENFSKQSLPTYQYTLQYDLPDPDNNGRQVLIVHQQSSRSNPAQNTSVYHDYANSSKDLPSEAIPSLARNVYTLPLRKLPKYRYPHAPSRHSSAAQWDPTSPHTDPGTAA